MTDDDKLMESALRRARDTRKLVVARGAPQQSRPKFSRSYSAMRRASSSPTRTHSPSPGKEVTTRCVPAAANACEPLVLEADGLYAEYSFVTRIQDALAEQRRHSRRRRLRLDQRPHEARRPPVRPAVSVAWPRPRRWTATRRSARRSRTKARSKRSIARRRSAWSPIWKSSPPRRKG